MRPATGEEPEGRLAPVGDAGPFTTDDLVGLPVPVRRYLAAAIAPGTPLITAARLRMRGHIKVGRWLPFRAREVLAPHRGFVWAGRVAGLIAGSDRYDEGAGGMEWKLGGVITLARAEGPDLSRSAAERAGAEAVWVPTALLPRFGVTWSAQDDAQITARYDTDGHPIELRLGIDADGHVRSFVFDRWGDPDRTGTWGRHPCGGEVTGYACFDGVTVPAAGRLGWFFGTDRWRDGEFFRYRITELRLLDRRGRK
jgi:hypothetical protein